ncbi:hypothetical protein [Planctomicrobium piriforme]|uniref:Uncharacterized protein n=1 Tax=Planctomicrobium piriforme TaxID=1576369 RepID=A0A1I3J7N5_9PLAN|nr:hypothetical protein [Planctomicrobium piriforme]SFI55998.1 hypothetical protein SAMN05421753_11079 [Planctomicrobium piriforme]
MSSSTHPHLGPCPICEQGQIRAARCPDCQGWVALCDECEAIWSDPRQFKTTKPTAQHPTCPHCGTTVEKWKFPNEQQLVRYGLEDMIVNRGAKSGPNS